MTRKEADQILLRVAKKNHVSLDTVRKEILFAMEEAQKCPDPKVQAQWASIPRKGEQITIEEFLDYACKRIKASSS